MIVCVKNKKQKQNFSVDELTRGNLYKAIHPNGHYGSGFICAMVNSHGKKYVLSFSHLGEDGAVDCIEMEFLKGWTFTKFDPNDSISITQE